MLTIKCANCKGKIYKYIKVGKGKLIHCWKDRIIEDYTVSEGENIRCQCGTTIGVDEGKWIKIKRHSLEYSGTISKSRKHI